MRICSVATISSINVSRVAGQFLNILVGLILEREDDIMTLGQKLKEIRKRFDLSQKRLGDIMNVSRQAITKWENVMEVYQV